MAPIITNGGQHPSDIRYGNSRLPMMDPVRPNIIVSETTIVLQISPVRSGWICVQKNKTENIYRIDVGNIATTEPTRAVELMLAMVI